ncbi:MAG: Uma2 family endonuclease [Acidobacteria bacterium]|nr:Uma2 family endonuclease [Acidobacteriota bacterium]
MTPALPDRTPGIEHLITEDDDPVDNLFSETQQRLLTEPLYSSWPGPGGGRTFLAAANVGIFYLARNPAIVPDVFLSLDVEVPEEFWSKEHRSYFLWEYGKAPDVCIEIVSNKVGGENDEKKEKYARMRVGYYVIFDPNGALMPDTLTIYRWNDFRYEQHKSAQFAALGLGLILWEGEYEGKHDRWLRWVDAEGKLIPTGKELAEQERLRAEQERGRAEQVEQLLQQERERAERLAEMLRQLGKDPNKF